MKSKKRLYSEDIDTFEIEHKGSETYLYHLNKDGKKNLLMYKRFKNERDGDIWANKKIKQLMKLTKPIYKNGYNYTPILELDPRQLYYIRFFRDKPVLSSDIIIDGKDIHQRVKERTEEIYSNKKERKELEKEINELKKKYPDREMYEISNPSGIAIVFRTKMNDKLYDWKHMKRIN